ncbi:hypothetical protein [Gemmatimonas sp.]|uniref:hypothetical protein n=1 Tax=Gemmatimonas sp. TaxID=1962908 RepID=UPI003F71D835
MTEHDARPRLLPSWTAATESGSTARAMYPLGIDPTTQSFEERLFSGITSQTPHVRYYAFYAWALTRFRQRLVDLGEAQYTEEFRRAERRWVARLEVALRVASIQADPAVRGMFGGRDTRSDPAIPPSGRVLRITAQTGHPFWLNPATHSG